MSGEDHYKAIIKTWYEVFSIACVLPEEHALNEIFAVYDCNKWDWSKLQQFLMKLAELSLKTLNTTSAGKDGIHNYCFKYGGKDVLAYVVRLFNTFVNGGPLLQDINEGLFVFLSKADEDDHKSLPTEGIFRGPTDLRSLTLKYTTIWSLLD